MILETILEYSSIWYIKSYLKLNSSFESVRNWCNLIQRHFPELRNAHRYINLLIDYKQLC